VNALAYALLFFICAGILVALYAAVLNWDYRVPHSIREQMAEIVGFIAVMFILAGLIFIVIHVLMGWSVLGG
jgi:p-aminobenzoyl-glutamate transporter AbgT